MAGFGRALKPGGRIVLAEPGAAHEHAQVSVDVMNKYGILEKGMELEDVRQYVAGTPLGRPEQVFLLRADHREIGKTLDRVFVQTHSAVEGNLFRIARKESLLETVPTAWQKPSSRRLAEGETARQSRAGQTGAHEVTEPLIEQPASRFTALATDALLTVACYLAAYRLRFDSTELANFLPSAAPDAAARGSVADRRASRHSAPTLHAGSPVVSAPSRRRACGHAAVGACSTWRSYGFEGVSRISFAVDALLLALAAFGWRAVSARDAPRPGGQGRARSRPRAGRPDGAAERQRRIARHHSIPANCSETSFFATSS